MVLPMYCECSIFKLFAEKACFCDIFTKYYQFLASIFSQKPQIFMEESSRTKQYNWHANVLCVPVSRYRYISLSIYIYMFDKSDFE